MNVIEEFVGGASLFIVQCSPFRAETGNGERFSPGFWPLSTKGAG